MALIQVTASDARRAEQLCALINKAVVTYKGGLEVMAAAQVLAWVDQLEQRIGSALKEEKEKGAEPPAPPVTPPPPKPKRKPTRDKAKK